MPRGHIGLDLVEEAAELGSPVAREARADHRARLHVQGGEQAGGAVAGVVVGAPLHLARPQRQERLRAVQRLHLALLVHAQHQRTIRRHEVETHDVADLLSEQRVGRELERLRAVRLQAKGAPDPAHRRHRQPARLGHRPQAPVRRTLGHRGQRAAHQRRDRLVADPPRRAGPGLVEQPVRALAREPLAPLAHRVLGDAEFVGDRRVAETVCCPQHDAHPQRQPLGRLAPSRPLLQLGALHLAQLQCRRPPVGHSCLHVSPNTLA
jgi:hypothetical protein